MYRTFIDRSHVQYDDVLEYLNSTIKSINFPGINLEPKTQTRIRGKKIQYKGSENIHDLIGGEITITLKSVDSHTNYFMLQHMYVDYYLDVERENSPNNIFAPPFLLGILDQNRDGVYYVIFDKPQFKSIGEITFDYSDSLVEDKTFTINFTYNFFEMEYILTKDLILRSDSITTRLNYDNQFNHDLNYAKYVNTLRNNRPPKTT